MKRTRIFGIALLMAGLTLAPAAAADLWLRIEVNGKKGEEVQMNLPFSMVEAFVPDEIRSSGRLRFHDRDYDVAELRRIMRQLEDSPDTTFLMVNEPDARVRVAKQGAYIVMNVLERAKGDNMEARIPLTVMGALLSGSGDQLNISAALREMARFGEGELLTVTGTEETVRIWVDDRPDR